MLGVFSQLGKWLVVNDPLPEDPDFIFVFGGDICRFEYALELSVRFPSCLLLIAADDYHRKRYRQRVKEADVSVEKIVFLDSCRNTLSEVWTLQRWLSVEGLLNKKIQGKGLLITSPYHTRRTASISTILFFSEKLLLSFRSVPADFDSTYNNDISQWWQRRFMRKMVLKELIATPLDTIRALVLRLKNG
jgi:uncharacterized SAM-binding protein YcdF (DUF218 family)